MKKIKKLLRLCFISLLILVILLPVCSFLFRLIWNFELLDPKSYSMMADYWEKGGVFKTAKDYTLCFSIILLPIIWLFLSYKLYKYGLIRFLLLPVNKIYHYLSTPKNLEVEHVAIKHLGEKNQTLDEVISERIKKENEKTAGGQSQTIKNLRQQISSKIEENENK